MMRRELFQRSIRWRALASLGLTLLTACGSTAPYYKDSAGRVREPTPDDPRLPYAVQQGEFLKDENLWPYATRGPMNFLGKYRFSHKWFVVRGFCEYGGMTHDKNVVSPDGAGRGRGFTPRSFTEAVEYGDVFERNKILFKQFRNRDDGSLQDTRLPARIGPGHRDGYFDSVCKLQADPQTGRYGGEATLAWVTITDASFEQLRASGGVKACEPVVSQERVLVEPGVLQRANGVWRGCVAERVVGDVRIRHTEIWMHALGDTGYHLKVSWSLQRPVILDSTWYEERQRAFMQVIDSVKIEKIP